jgi:putative DNA primase/helicase
VEWACYQPVEENSLRAQVYRFLETFGSEELGYVVPRKRFVDEIVDALKSKVFFESVGLPRWICDPITNSKLILPVANGLYCLESDKLYEHTPNYLNKFILPVHYDPNSQSPVEFLSFLDSIWPEDSDSILALQEWMGLLLTGITKYQKALMIVGPKRSGKGTIARLISNLIGARNISSPTLSSLSGGFGLAPLIGKQIAFISDARFGAGQDSSAAVEAILRVTGEDHLSIDRKYRTAWEGRLKVRIIILTNELPSLTDSSGALASRFIILRMRNSFLGREDIALDTKLLKELPGILNWAIKGLNRLLARGYLLQPASGHQDIEAFTKIGSPIQNFIDECCEVEPAHHVTVNDLFNKWLQWCEGENISAAGTKQSFGKKLSAVAPSISITQKGSSYQRVRIYQGISLKPNLVDLMADTRRHAEN